MVTSIFRKIEVLKEGFEALELARTKFDAVEFPEAVKIVEKAMIDIHNLIFSKPAEPAMPEESYLTPPKPNAERLGKKDETNDDKNLIWIEISENIRYAYDEENEMFILQHKKDGKFQTLKTFRYEDLKRIWDALPERATAEDVRDAAKRVGVSICNLEHYLMRIFTHVKFGGDITTEKTGGNPRLVLIKNPEGDFSLAEETRRRLEQEREVIGPMYSP